MGQGKFLRVTNSVTHLFHLYHYLMQSSTAMQQSCTHAQGNCFFPVNKEKEKKLEEEEEMEVEEENN